MNDSSDNMVLQSDKNVVIDEVLDDNDDRSGNDSNGDDDHYTYVKKAPQVVPFNIPKVNSSKMQIPKLNKL